MVVVVAAWRNRGPAAAARRVWKEHGGAVVLSEVSQSTCTDSSCCGHGGLMCSCLAAACWPTTLRSGSRHEG